MALDARPLEKTLTERPDTPGPNSRGRAELGGRQRHGASRARRAGCHRPISDGAGSTAPRIVAPSRSHRWITSSHARAPIPKPFRAIKQIGFEEAVILPNSFRSALLAFRAGISGSLGI